METVSAANKLLERSMFICPVRRVKAGQSSAHLTRDCGSVQNAMPPAVKQASDFRRIT